MNKKIKVALLSGGPSSEHEVSLKSSENVLKNLDLDKFEILHINISKKGAWIEQATGLELSEAAAIKYIKDAHVDLVFIMLHGEYGEDGTIQKLLETEGIRFTGSSSKASSIAMDKITTSGILADASLHIPAYIQIKTEDL
jgi:D-alanine-D-alanine ligase